MENRYMSSLITQYTFYNYVVGKSNRRAFNAAVCLADQDRGNTKLLIISGDEGIGKTHLMHSIGNEMLEKNPSTRVCCINGEDFVRFMKLEGKDKFEQECNGIDIFLFDDMQFLNRKMAYQKILAKTMELLKKQHIDVVITCDSYFLELKEKICLELMSKIREAYIVKVGMPEFETKMEISRRFCKKESADVSEDVLNYLCRHCKKNIRALLWALIRIISRSKIDQQKISIKYMREILSDFLMESR